LAKPKDVVQINMIKVVANRYLNKDIDSLINIRVS